MESIGVGDVGVRLLSHGRARPALIKDVLHCTRMGEAVLSNSKLADTGVSCLTMPTYIDLVHITTGKLIIQAPQVGNLYQVYVEIIQPEQSFLAQGHLVLSMLLALWH